MNNIKDNVKVQGEIRIEFFKKLIFIGCLGIGYFSPLIAIIMILFTWKKPEKKIYGKLAGIGAVGGLGMFILTYIPMII